ncbi:hypothetical protein HJG60_004961 [Phyllostomus discolor]|uniref:TB domain-containing protein n=1 Tax=Phyllostomus discolor TaxID=89673 RepID=A0A833ZJF8_9CHIR|nr:hypothetical protein HJG60_004961 [Phyllostomus discolor]
MDTPVHSTCYGALNNGSCTRPLLCTVTKPECCCASPDHGFGEPCQLCPAKNSDTNECEVFPGVCPNGRCCNTAGSFCCKCPQGLTLDTMGRLGHSVAGPGLVTVSCAVVCLEVCFLRWDEDNCGVPLSGKYRMDVCCCSMGAAWGAACEAYPMPESLAFTSLCP